MNNAIAYRGHQVGGGRGFQRTTTTTTTTTTTQSHHTCPSNHSNGVGRGLFANDNQGRYNNFNSGAGGGVQLSSKAQMMMAMMGMMSAMMTGDFGQLMQMMNGMNGQQMPQGYGQVPTQGGPQGVPAGRPSFGGPRRTRAVRNAQALNGANIPGMSPGQVKEMEPGQTAKGANGSVVQWGQDGTVNVSYRDKNGRQKQLSVKDGMITMDGQPPKKLENVGQLLKLPNGDVVGLGNNPGPNGKSLVRVVMSDNANHIKCEPASATNIYDIASMDPKETRYEGGGVSVNMNAGAYNTPMGSGSYMNFSISQFLGTPVTRLIPGPTTMAFGGVK